LERRVTDGEADTKAAEFPRQKARTRNFTLGVPRDFQVAADGTRVVFLRSLDGDDPITALWSYEVATDEERLVVDPRALAAQDSLAGGVPPDEQARRERRREVAGGIVAYACDLNANLATFALSGMLCVADLRSGRTRSLDVPMPVVDPRLTEKGDLVGFVHDRALYVASSAGDGVRRLVADERETVTWGLAEFVGAEELGRDRGFWWAPDGSMLLVARVDEEPVQQWWLADGVNPSVAPQSVRYPAAGTANAVVRLHLIAVGDAPSVEVQWDGTRYPYVLAVDWDPHGPMITVQTRDQREVVVLAVNPRSGMTTRLDEQRDELWVDTAEGVPRRLADGRLINLASVRDASALTVDGVAVTPSDMEVRAVLDARDDRVLFTASTEPPEVHVWRWSATDGLAQVTSTSGVHTAAAGGDLCVVGSSTLEHDSVRWSTRNHVFESRDETPVVTPSVKLITVGARQLRVGVLFPRDHEPGHPLPVLLDPYGGPGRQRVLAARRLWLEAQWFADQGFAVVVADGRGTPGRGRAWSRAVHGDLAGPPLDDQVAALTEVASIFRDIDLTRVAIRGWSFGGYLAALAVLRRPDFFHAAIAGAPVTDWRLYDTHYSERYLGTDPDGADGPFYDSSSLLDVPLTQPRPLLLIHGLADANVVAAHTLALSRRLLEGGWPHAVLPLSGVTHMTPQVAIAENLLLIQAEFLQRTLVGCG
jgi:dipeptidyl-peptidase-4